MYSQDPPWQHPKCHTVVFIHPNSTPPVFLHIIQYVCTIGKTGFLKGSLDRWMPSVVGFF